MLTRIADTYVKNSTAGLTGGLYDSYIKAIRWASDRLGNQGVIGFITNAGWLDSRSATGLRKSIYQEFNYLYIYNLRGAVRGRSGDLAKKEGGNVFDILTGVCISILVKDGSNNHELRYADIGDYQSRQQKFKAISAAQSVKGIDWTELKPDVNNDWLNQRDMDYQRYMAISAETPSVFKSNAIGTKTNRDAWLYGFSKIATHNKVKLLTEHYTQELNIKSGIPVNRDGQYIKWSPKLEQLLKRGQKIGFDENKIRLGLYRPYTKKYLYYDTNLVERPGLYYKQFGDANEVIFTTGRGSSKDFSVLATDLIPDIQTLMNGQGFMRYNNEESNQVENILSPERDNVSQEFAAKLGLTTDETYAYVYGLLNSPEYQQKYANDLKKELARIPIVKNIRKYVEVGQQLLDLHINYEEVEPYDGCKVIMHSDEPSYRVKKMDHKPKSDLSTIVFNSDITITNIPERAYDYVVNGRSAIGWIIDQYQVKTDKVSRITDDPNEYSDDPQYIFKLLLRVITVSLRTLDLVAQLPEFEVAE